MKRAAAAREPSRLITKTDSPSQPYERATATAQTTAHTYTVSGVLTDAAFPGPLAVPRPPSHQPNLAAAWPRVSPKNRAPCPIANWGLLSTGGSALLEPGQDTESQPKAGAIRLTLSAAAGHTPKAMRKPAHRRASRAALSLSRPSFNTACHFLTPSRSCFPVTSPAIPASARFGVTHPTSPPFRQDNVRDVLCTPTHFDTADSGRNHPSALCPPLHALLPPIFHPVEPAPGHEAPLSHTTTPNIGHHVVRLQREPGLPVTDHPAL